jgi:S1-C subfamily serine protease
VVDGASTITVIFADGTQVDAELVGSDAATDVAVLDGDVAAEKLTPLPRGDSGNLQWARRSSPSAAPSASRGR